MKESQITRELNNDGVNRYKYQSFKSRVENIKIDVIHRVQKIGEEQETDISFFNDSLQSWRELNLTSHFTAFTREVNEYTQSLVQLLYHKEHVIEILEKHLLIENSMAIEPLLELVTKLAKDLETEFYPYFHRILTAIIPLTKHRDIRILESTFNCIAYLFKYLSKQLSSDLKSTFRLLAPLLGEDSQHKPYIRRFAAESFAYLVRKARGQCLLDILNYMLDCLRESPTEEFIDGLATLIFESVKQVDNRLHSRGTIIMKESLQCLYLDTIAPSNATEQSATIRCIQNAFIILLHRTKREHLAPIFDMIILELDDQIKILSDQKSAESLYKPEDLRRCGLIMSIVTICLNVHNGTRVLDYNALFARAKIIARIILTVSSTTISPFIIQEFWRMISSLLLFAELQDVFTKGKDVLEVVFQSKDVSAVLVFATGLEKLKWTNYTQIMLPYITKYCSMNFSTHRTHIIFFLAYILESSIFTLSMGMTSPAITKDGLVQFPEASASILSNPNQIDHDADTGIVAGLLQILEADIDWEKELDELNNITINGNSDPSYITLLSACLSIIPHVSIPFELLSGRLCTLLKSLADFLLLSTKLTLGGKSQIITSHLVTAETLLGQVLQSLTKVCQHAGDKGMHILGQVWDTVFSLVLDDQSKNDVYLRGLAAYMEILKSSVSHRSFFTSSALETIYPHLKTLIGSYRRSHRLYALKIFSLFNQLPLKQMEDFTIEEECPVFSLALSMEEIDTSVENYRDKNMKLRLLTRLIRTKRVPAFYAEVLPRVCLGLLTVNFQPVWSDAIDALEQVAQMEPKTFWDVIFEQFINIDQKEELLDNNLSNPTSKLPLSLITKISSTRVKREGFFECPSLKKIYHAFEEATQFIELDIYMKGPINVDITPQERFDLSNYCTLLLKTLSKVPHISEQYARQLIPVFIEFVGSKYETTFESEIERGIDNEDEEKQCNSNNMDLDIDSSLKTPLIECSTKVTRMKMIAWLQLFSNFKNPRQLYKSKELKNIYLWLLSKGDSDIQSLALDCLFTWKSTAVEPYRDNLKNLLNEIKFRDELSTFILDQAQSSIDPTHRQEVMPIILRVLYGRMISHKGHGSSKAGMHTRRTAVLAALAGCSENELNEFVELMLEPFSDFRTPGIVDEYFQFTEDIEFSIPWRKQLGFLHILGDVIKQLGLYIAPFIEDLLKVNLYIIYSSEKLRTTAEALDNSENKHISLDKGRGRLRQLGLKRFMEFFKLNVVFNFRPYVRAAFDSVIRPRIPRFDVENTQSPSILLELFAVWAGKAEYIEFLVDYDSDVLPKVFSIMSAPKVHDSVLAVVLNIAENILECCREEIGSSIEQTKTLSEKILLPHVTCLLDNLAHILTKKSEILKVDRGISSEREINLVSQIATFIEDGVRATKVLDLLLPNLKKSARIVPERTKGMILRTVLKFLRILPDFYPGSPLYMRYYGLFALMLNTLTTRESRMLLISIFDQLTAVDDSLLNVSKVIQELNSYSGNRLDEPDFDRRLNGFEYVNHTLHSHLNATQWLPILHNFIFSVQDIDEMAIRSSASFGLTRFIDRCTPDENTPVNIELLDLLTHVVYPGIKKGLKHKMELVRMEFIAVLGHAVKKLPSFAQFEDMVTLLANNDEEANFFNNIYHIQLHRRIRALKRLSVECSSGALRPVTLINFFLPLIDHFIFEADRIEDHNLINQAISTLGVIASCLSWPKYYSMLKQYLKMVSRKAGLEKILVRVIIIILDNFHFDLSNAKTPVADLEVGLPNLVQSKTTPLSGVENSNANPVKAVESLDPIIEETDDEDVNRMEEVEFTESSNELALRILDSVQTRLLPELERYLTNKDDMNVTIRVPIALAIIKILQALPEKSKRASLPKFLTSLCQIMKSRQQEVRDTTRDTLLKISASLGPSYFSFIVKELKGALTRGYQLHVLGFTLNSLLVDMIPQLQVGELDHCLGDIVKILIDDAFGEISYEKETEEIKGKMKETKSMRSFESFELLASIVEFHSIGIILLPAKEIISETENLNMARKIKEWLRHIAIGLNRNAKLETKELLLFCHGLITENLDLSKPMEKHTHESTRLQANYDSNYKLQLKRNVQIYENHFAANAHMFVEFGLSVFHSALNRNRFDVKSQPQLELLDPFVTIVGNALYSKHTNIVILATKIFCILCKLPLPSLASSVGVIIKQIITLIKSAGNTNSDLVQSCFKLLTVCIRDCRDTEISEHQVTFLVNLIRPDLEEPNKQGTTFALVRAIISRKFITPEVYDLVEQIAEIMVTSQSAQVRELCRHVYLQFLLDYPQGRGRLKNQMNFLVKNMEYIYESGRESVMEMMNAIFSKFNDDILGEYSEMFLLALVMRLINDDSAKCREMAAALIKSLLQHMNKKNISNTYKLLDQWAQQSQQQNLQRAACQVYGLAVDAFAEQFKSNIPTLISHLKNILENSKAVMLNMEEVTDSQMDVDIEWEVGYYSLATFTKLTLHFSTIILSEKSSAIWHLVKELMCHPHSWIRLSASRLLAFYFANADPLTRAIYGTKLADPFLCIENLHDIAANHILQLRSEHLTEELGVQVVKNLVFIGKCFYHLKSEEYNIRHENDESDPDDEYVVPDKDIEEGSKDSYQSENEKNKDSQYTTLPNGQEAPKPALLWLFKKMSFSARTAISKRGSRLQLIVIFQWFGAIANVIDAEQLQRYLIPIIAPISRIVNDSTRKSAEFDELKQLGQEVLDLVQKCVGTSRYVQAFSSVQQQISNVRKERKIKRSFQALADPEAHARRRLQKSEMKKNNVRRKKAEAAKIKNRLTVRKRRHEDA